MNYYNAFLFVFRLCSLTLDRLQVLKPLENDLSTVIIAVKMQVNSEEINNFMSLVGMVIVHNVTDLNLLVVKSISAADEKLDTGFGSTYRKILDTGFESTYRKILYK